MQEILAGREIMIAAKLLSQLGSAIVGCLLVLVRVVGSTTYEKNRADSHHDNPPSLSSPNRRFGRIAKMIDR